MPRVLKTPFVERWHEHVEDVRRQAASIQEELMSALRGGRGSEYLAPTGESAGLIDEILPAGEIVRRMVQDAERVLRDLPAIVGERPSS